MIALIQQTGQRWWNWAVNNPQQFFTYSMIFLSVSFIGSMIQGIFFPPEMAFKIKPPVLYSKSHFSQGTAGNREKEMERIVAELKTLKIKRDRHALQKEDSLRIEYLFNQFQQLKNGH